MPPLGRDEGCPDQLRENESGFPEERFHRVEVSLLSQLSREVQVRQVVFRQVVDLNDPARPAPGAVRAVELEDPAESSVLTDSFLHRAVFRGRGLPESLPDLQDPPDFRRKIFLFEERLHIVLPELRDVHSFALDPWLQLCEAVGVAEAGDLPRLFQQLRPALLIVADDVVYHR